MKVGKVEEGQWHHGWATSESGQEKDMNSWV